MKDFYIEERCTQNWDKMPKTPNGTYCDQCSMEVFDFTNKSSEEIRAMLLRFKNTQLCTRMTVEQEAKLNREYEIWKVGTKKHMQRATFFSFLIVFGLSFISCTEEKDREELSNFRQQIIESFKKEPESKLESIEASNITDPTSDIKERELSAVPEIIQEEVIIERTADEVVCVIEGIKDIPERQYILGGAVISTVHYADYLEEVVPEKDKQFDDEGREIPTEFSALAFPNPTRGLTTLKLEIPDSSDINISVLSLNGQKLHDFETRTYYPGTHELGFDLTDYPAGMYLIMIQSAKFKDIVRVSKQ